MTRVLSRSASVEPLGARDPGLGLCGACDQRSGRWSGRSPEGVGSVLVGWRRP